MKNIPLLIFDIICLPITTIRMILIYFNGSCYGIRYLEFLDVMLHSHNKYFNQTNKLLTIDTLDDDIRLSINHSSRLDELSVQLKNEINDMKDNKNNHKINSEINHKIDEVVVDIDNINIDDVNIDEVGEIKNYNENYENYEKYNENNKKINSKLENKMNNEMKNKLDFMSFDVNLDSITD